MFFLRSFKIVCLSDLCYPCPEKLIHNQNYLTIENCELNMEHFYTLKQMLNVRRTSSNKNCPAVFAGQLNLNPLMTKN
jgi:hypothetical protein